MTDDRLTVREAQTTDTLALAAVIQGCGPFMPEEAEDFIASLPEHFASKGEGRVWLLAGEGAGAAYRSPEIGPGVWNLLFLGGTARAASAGRGPGLGSRSRGAGPGGGWAMLLIDTSTMEAQKAARTLYGTLGDERVGLIPDYWGPGDGKVTFRRAL